jgi:hypothetical protein
MPLSKLDIAALRKADDLCVHLSQRCPKGLVRAIKRKPMLTQERDPFATDIEHIIDAPVTLDGFCNQKLIENGTVKCFGSVGLYHSQHTPASSAIKTLRAGDEIEFAFEPDGHTNGYVAAAGLHGDVLKLIVRRKGKRVATWKLESSMCPRNSARMCDGMPKPDWYDSRAADARGVR